MDDLVAFLSARLDEDEAAAKKAAEESPAPWAENYGDLNDSSGELIVDGVGYGGAAWHLHAPDHIARHDPARVLAEVAAKRAILGDHHWVTDGGCSRCRAYDARGPMPYPCAVVRTLAAIYSTHPDYQPEWKPEGAHAS